MYSNRNTDNDAIYKKYDGINIHLETPSRKIGDRFDIAYSTQSSSSLLSFSSELATEFDTKGWKQSRLYLTGGINLPFGKVSSINFSDTVNVFVGRGNTYDYEIKKSFFCKICLPNRK